MPVPANHLQPSSTSVTQLDQKPSTSRRVVIGLGSNLGDRTQTIHAAIDMLRSDPDFNIVSIAPCYETPPVGGPPQPNFINSAVLVLSSLSARTILHRLLCIERMFGRIRPDPVRWGPRTIDMDLLWIDGETVTYPELVVPHPRLRERQFALRPLLDVAPDACDPRTGESYASLSLPTDTISPVHD